MSAELRIRSGLICSAGLLTPNAISSSRHGLRQPRLRPRRLAAAEEAEEPAAEAVEAAREGLQRTVQRPAAREVMLPLPMRMAAMPRRVVAELEARQPDVAALLRQRMRPRQPTAPAA